MNNVVRIPKVFLEDCRECCDCEVPESVKTTKTHYWISTERNEQMDELISRAVLYANSSHWDRVYIGLCSSAKATLKALHKAEILNDHEIALCRRNFGYPPYDFSNPKDRELLGA